MLAATTYSLIKARAELDLSGLGQIAIGFAAAFVTALLVIRALLASISRIGFTPFGLYRIDLGTLILLWLAVR